MSILYTRVTEVGPRVIDPVTDQIVAMFTKKLAVDELIGANVVIDNDRTAVSLVDDGEGNINMSNDRLVVTVDEHFSPTEQHWPDYPDYNTLSAGTSKRYSHMYQPLFIDADAGFAIREMTASFGLTLRFRFEFLSYDVATEVLTALYDMDVGNQVNYVQDIVVNYPITMGVLKALYSVYRCKQDYKSKSLWEYFVDHVTSDVQVDARREDLLAPERWDNLQLAVGFKRIQMDCRGKVNCDQNKPEVMKVEQCPNAYVVEFEYLLQFGRPDVLQITMPISVDQQMLPSRMFDKLQFGFLSFLSGTMQDNAYDTVIKQIMSAGKDGMKCIARFPYYDNWDVPYTSPVKRRGYQPLVIGLTLLDNLTTGGSSMSFSPQLDDVVLSDFVKEIMALHQASDIFTLNALFNITVYADDVPLDPSLLTWDPKTLTVAFSGSRISSQYRVVLSETTDLKQVNPQWYPVLLKYRYYFPLLIMRNLDQLSKLGFYTIESTPDLCKLILKARARGMFQPILRKMVAAGDADSSIYQFTQTSTQFADYISNTESLKGGVDRSLFTAFIEQAIAAGLTTKTTAPGLYLKSPKGYPYGPHQGGFDGFSLPLRVFNTVISSTATN